MGQPNPFTEVIEKIELLDKKLDLILQFLNESSEESRKITLPNAGGIAHASKITGLAKSTIYKMTSTGEIPFSKPTGGKLIFVTEDLLQWCTGNYNVNQSNSIEIKKRKK